MRFISIKARVTIYFTLMMLLVVCLVMGTILIAGRGVMSDSAEGTLLALAAVIEKGGHTGP